eukprot:g12.t1 g12   contig1:28787-30398(-)
MMNEEIPAFGGEINSKLENNMRFAFQNVNGLRIGSTHEGSELALVIESRGIDVLGMAETNIHWNQDRRTQLLSLLQMVFGNGQIATSSSQSGTDGYQPGGTALVAHGCSAGRISCRKGDRMGRYLYMASRGKEGCGVLVISAYRVCQSRGTVAGPDTAFMQQVAALRSAGVVNPDPRNQILDDLTDLINEWKEKGYHPLIGIDANATLDETRFAEFLDRNQLVDVLGTLNTGDPPSTSQEDGSLREIHHHQKIGERVQALELAFQKEGKTEALEQRYNRLDYEIRCSMLAAANAQARKSFGYQWSPALVTAGRMKRFWRIVTSSKRRHSKVAPAALRLAETLQIPTDNLDDLRLAVCHRNLHEAAKRLRQVQRNDAEERLKWLEDLAQEAMRDDPTSDWQQILKRLVTATKTKALHRKLSAVLKPERAGMDHIEVPQEGWYYSPSVDELYEFDNGIFRAHKSQW